MKTTKKPAKEVIVIAKYTIKRNGAVIYRVRSNQPNKKGRVEGTDQVERNGLWYNAYNVTVYKNETVCGCTCPGSEYKGKCTHRDFIQAKLDAQHVETPAQPAVKPKVADLGTRGTLNGAQHSVGFWASLPSRQKKSA